MGKGITREDCINLLQGKFKEIERLPKKSDFPEDVVARIKAFYGPWPRALEEAGIKECRPEEVIQKKKDKKIRSKIRLREYKKKI